MRIHRVVVCAMIVGLGVGVPPAYAQGQGGRIEVGGHASLLRLSDFGFGGIRPAVPATTSAGLGGRVIFDLSRWLAIDGEVQFFPNDDILSQAPGMPIVDIAVVHHRRRADGFFGVKIGARGNKLGLFGRVRPGFTRLIDQGVECVGPSCAVVLFLLARDEYRTEFALDVGGGVEFYPSRRTVARLEFGDTMIRHRSFAPPCWVERCTTHNFTTRIGGGVRF